MVGSSPWLSSRLGRVGRYCISGGHLGPHEPGEFSGDGGDDRANLYRDPAWRQRVRAATTDPSWGLSWERLSVQESDAHPELLDRSIAEIAKERGVEPLDVMCVIALDDELATRFRLVIANYEKEELGTMLADDRALLGLSDAGAHASQLCDAVFSSYLLEHWVREKSVLSLEKRPTDRGRR